VGADRPGDLARILRIATPDAVVVTRLPDVPVHVEAYTTPRAVREEEFAPAYALSVGAPLIVSSRDVHAIKMAEDTRATTITVGFSKDADVHLDEPKLLCDEGKPVGMQTVATVGDTAYTLEVRGALGKPQVLAPAMALALAASLGIPPAHAVKGLRAYLPPAGRGRLLPGKNGSMLIDDSYNASPAAVEEALDSLSLIPKARRIAVLGDMLELGRYSASEHERIGTLAAKKTDVLVTVGQRSRATAQAALAAGMAEESVRSFDTSVHAAEYLERAVQEKDVVLIKGSQSIRTERIVKALLGDAADSQYLVRQETEWQKR
jgi:UDP-N-acetylmuramoyl-tripeptide--D-alanyl-D-alanine ligase